MNQGPDGHHLAFGIANVEVADIVWLDPEPVVGLGLDLPGPSEFVEIVDISRTQVCLQRAEYLA